MVLELAESDACPVDLRAYLGQIRPFFRLFRQRQRSFKDLLPLLFELVPSVRRSVVEVYRFQLFLHFKRLGGCLPAFLVVTVEALTSPFHRFLQFSQHTALVSRAEDVLRERASRLPNRFDRVLQGVIIGPVELLGGERGMRCLACRQHQLFHSLPFITRVPYSRDLFELLFYLLDSRPVFLHRVPDLQIGGHLLAVHDCLVPLSVKFIQP